MTNPHHPQFDCDLHARHEQNETERLRRRVAELEAYNATRTDELAAATKRITELEAALPLYDELLIRCAIAEKELAALRKRIEDAQVVMWVHKDNDLLIRRTWPNEEGFYAVIRKKDLTK